MLANLPHYIRKSAHILLTSNKRPCSRLQLLSTYCALILKSFLRHRIAVKSASNVTKVWGHTVAYSTLPVLINLYEEIFIEGAYHFESSTSRPIILDCGSNIGMSVLYFKMLYPEAMITAFEPDSASFSFLARNVRENNLQQVTLINAAVSLKKGERLLYTPSQKDASLNASLLPIENPGASASVKTEQLSTFITGPVDCVKIDVEGSEFEVLEDLIITKKINFVKHMVIEFHQRQVTVSREDFIKMIEDEGLAVTVQEASATESLLVCTRP